jgi:hypothetical protein
MSTQASPSTSSRTSINLVRSSHSWTETNSAGGIVLRYLSPLRKQLAVVLGSSAEADAALKILLNHLVAAGFGEHGRGRLRDFLAKAARSAAKARLTELERLESDREKLDRLRPESEQWIQLWRDGLLERSWRGLERMEHLDPEKPYFTVLWTRTTMRKSSPAEWKAALETRLKRQFDPQKLETLRVDAKAAFAQILADEIVETLETPDKDAVKSEIHSLGISGAFSGLTV